MTTPKLVLCDDCNCSLKILPQSWVSDTINYFNTPQEELNQELQGEQQ